MALPNRSHHTTRPKHVTKVRSDKIAASIAILKWWHKEQEESENVNPQSHRKKLIAQASHVYVMNLAMAIVLAIPEARHGDARNFSVELICRKWSREPPTF